MACFKGSARRLDGPFAFTVTQVRNEVVDSGVPYSTFCTKSVSTACVFFDGCSRLRHDCVALGLF